MWLDSGQMGGDQRQHVLIPAWLVKTSHTCSFTLFFFPSVTVLDSYVKVELQGGTNDPDLTLQISWLWVLSLQWHEGGCCPSGGGCREVNNSGLRRFLSDHFLPRSVLDQGLSRTALSSHIQHSALGHLRSFSVFFEFCCFILQFFWN